MEKEYDTTKTLSGLPAPDCWHVIDQRGNKDGAYWFAWQRLKGEALLVIETIAEKDDGHAWLHVSISKPSKKMPTYDDMQILRKYFVGEDRECYMVFPPAARYVNIHPAVLHLYCCLSKPEGVLPHFEGELKIDGQKRLSV